MNFKSKSNIIQKQNIKKGKFLTEEHKLYLKYIKPLNKIKFDNRKHLIYIIAYSNMYKSMANMLINSLKTLGEYKDKIYLFTDSLSGLNYLNDTQVKIIIPNIPELKSKSYNKNWLKLNLDKYISTSDFDQIMYLDCDILCLKPIESLFNAYSCLKYANECVPSNVSKIYHLNHFADNEIEFYGKTSGINSGQFCIDSSLYINLLTIWKKLLTSPDQKDQSAFNYLIKKNLIKSKNWDINLVQFWNNSDLNTSLIHFPHRDKQFSYDKMIETYNQLFTKS